MKNIFNTKKSLAAALSRYGRVLSLLVVGLALSSGAWATAKTIYIDCSGISGITAMTKDYVQSQNNTQNPTVTISNYVASFDFDFDQSGDGGKLKYKFKITVSGSDKYPTQEQLASSYFGTNNCVKITYNGSSFTYTPTTYGGTQTVPSIYIGQKPVVNGTSATINLQLSDWGCQNVTAVKIYHVSEGEPTTSSSDPWQFTLDPAKSSNTNFSVVKTNIPSGTYNIKAQAQNSVGWSTTLSDLATFTISGCDAPTLTAAYNATKSSTSISVDAGITAMGSCGLNAFGVEYSVNSDMSGSTKKSATSVPSAVGTQTVAITGLTSNTKYYYRTYAGLSSGGETTSPQQNDFTLPELNSSHSEVTSAAVKISGKILAGGNFFSNANSGTEIFEISKENTFSQAEGTGYQAYAVGGAVGTDYNHQFTGLTATTKYYYRLKAEFTDSGHTFWAYSTTGEFTTNSKWDPSKYDEIHIDAMQLFVGDAALSIPCYANPAPDSWTFVSSNASIIEVVDNNKVQIKGSVTSGSVTITGTAHKTNYDDTAVLNTATICSLNPQASYNGTEYYSTQLNYTFGPDQADLTYYLKANPACSGATSFSWVCDKTGEDKGWDYATGFDGDEEDPQITFYKAGLYEFTVTATYPNSKQVVGNVKFNLTVPAISANDMKFYYGGPLAENLTPASDCNQSTTWNLDNEVNDYYGYPSSYQTTVADLFTANVTCAPWSGQERMFTCGYKLKDAAGDPVNFINLSGARVTYRNNVSRDGTSNRVLVDSNMGLVNGSPIKLTINYYGGKYFIIDIDYNCTKPASVTTPTSVYNGGEAPWNEVFADGHRSAVLSTETTGYAYYQWYGCDADGNNENATPANVTFTNANTATCTAEFSLPGTYYFKVKVGCGNNASYSMYSSPVQVNVPFPEMRIAGPFYDNDWSCTEHVGGEDKVSGLMERNGLTWSKVFHVRNYESNFAVFQRYKGGNVAICGTTADTEGWYLGSDQNKIPFAQYATRDGVLQDGSTNNLLQNISATEWETVRLTVTMTQYNSYTIKLEKVLIFVVASKSYRNDQLDDYGNSADRVRVVQGSTIDETVANYYTEVIQLADKGTKTYTLTPLPSSGQSVFMGWSYVPDGDRGTVTMVSTDNPYLFTIPSDWGGADKDTLYAHFATPWNEAIPAANVKCTSYTATASLRSYASGVNVSGSLIVVSNGSDHTVSSNVSTKWKAAADEVVINNCSQNTQYTNTVKFVKDAATYTAPNTVPESGNVVTTHTAPTIMMSDAQAVYPWEYSNLTASTTETSTLTWRLYDSADNLLTTGAGSGANYVFSLVTDNTAYKLKGISSDHGVSSTTFKVKVDAVSTTTGCAATPVTRIVTINEKETEQCNQ